MSDSQSSSPIHAGVGTVILSLAGAVAITPLIVAGAMLRSDSVPGAKAFLAVAALWALCCALYRGLEAAHRRRRRSLICTELADVRRARLEAANAFQDNLHGHNAILERIVEITETIVADGITDPQVTLRNVDLIASHARDARVHVEDAIIEAQVETGSHTANFEPVNARDEIEEVVAPFLSRGVSVATSGPRGFVKTDPAMYRVIVRSLVASAVDRATDDIDVLVARDGDTVVCTVSDGGRDCAAAGLESASPLARSLTSAVGAELRYSRVLGRNQFSVVAAAAEEPEGQKQENAPLDVLGTLPPSAGRSDSPPDPRQIQSHEDLITFLKHQERDRDRSVAARRREESLAR